MARILTLLTKPKEELIAPYLNPERQEGLRRVADRADLLLTMGLNVHEASRYRQDVANTVKTLLACNGEGDARASAP